MIRAATSADLEAINAIFNHYVPRSTCTFQIDPSSAADRQRWFADHGPAHPVLVHELDGEVIGWGSLGPFHQRQAYARTVEDSIYVRHDRHGRGVGRELLAALVARARELGHHAVMALIEASQDRSLTLHRAAGFVEVGRLREVGRKFDRWLDVAYLELLL
jgi:phosphinothricin acetyltransferase